MLIVGVTGGVASGKTTISRVFEEEGAHRIDADRIARELVQTHSPAWRELTRAFGKEILQKNGTIDRKKLAHIAFSDSGQRRLLNEILHPRIKKEMGKRARRIKRKAPNAIVVFDVPLLVETGFHQEVDRVVVVTSTKAQQIERLRKRAGMSPKETRRIIASQMDIKEKMKVADFVIRNEGSIAQTRRRAREVFQELRRIALQKRRRPTDQYKRGGAKEGL